MSFIAAIGISNKFKLVDCDTLTVESTMANAFGSLPRADAVAVVSKDQRAHNAPKQDDLFRLLRGRAEPVKLDSGWYNGSIERVRVLFRNVLNNPNADIVCWDRTQFNIWISEAEVARKKAGEEAKAKADAEQERRANEWAERERLAKERAELERTEQERRTKEQAARHRFGSERTISILAVMGVLIFAAWVAYGTIAAPYDPWAKYLTPPTHAWRDDPIVTPAHRATGLIHMKAMRPRQIGDTRRSAANRA
jgi:hypothetical protein